MLISSILIALSHTAFQATPAALDTAIARMGGLSALRAVSSMRVDAVVQWLRPNYLPSPFADGVGSYEVVADLRDYSSNAWRNTRRSITAGGFRDALDIVRDTIGARRFAPGPQAPEIWAPLNTAYVDERREVFAFAPERVLLLASADAGARALSDTTIGGAAHARVVANLGGYNTTLIFRRSDGHLAAAVYRAEQPLDFGLAPWGPMQVEVWYSRWGPLPNGLVYPGEMSIRRAGSAYKRISLLRATPNAAAPADSFAIADSVVAKYLAQNHKPMHDIALDSARMIGQRFAQFGTPGYPVGAVKLGGSWYLLGGGTGALNAKRAAEWLAAHDEGAKTAGAIVTVPSPANGGIAWLTEQRLPVRVGRSMRPTAATILTNRGLPSTGLVEVKIGQWLRAGSDSMWVEPVQLSDTPDALALYIPSEEWAFTPSLVPTHVTEVLSQLRRRGWKVTKTGSPRAMATAAP